MAQKTLSIFIDESGDLNFTSKSSKHFYMGALVVSDIDSDVIGNLYDIRHRHLCSDAIYKSNQGKDLEYFHATEDIQVVRDEVFLLIQSQSSEELRFYVVYTDKNKANPALYEKTELYYSKHVIWLTNSILYQESISKYDSIMIFFDGMPVANNKKAMFKSLKEEISRFFDEKDIHMPYFIYSHQSKSHHYLQLADYMNWAINVWEERDEDRPYQCVKKFIKNIWNPFEKGIKIYYEHTKNSP